MERSRVATSRVPAVFIDPVYKERLADENEKKINKNQTDLLWKLLTDPSRKEFICDKRCKAPSGFFSGINIKNIGFRLI